MRKLILLFLLISTATQAQFTWDQIGKVKTKNDQFGQAVGAWKLVLNVADSGLYILTEKRNATDSLQTAFRLNKYRALKYSTSTSGVDTVNVVATKYDLTQIGGADYDSILWRKAGNSVKMKSTTDSLYLNDYIRYRAGYGDLYAIDALSPYTSYGRLLLRGSGGQGSFYLGAYGSSGFGGSGNLYFQATPLSSAMLFGFETDFFGTYSYQLDEYGFYPPNYSTAGTYNQFLGIPAKPWNDGYLKKLHLTNLTTSSEDTLLMIDGLEVKKMHKSGLGYITGNQSITLSGDVSGSGTTSITATVADDSHNHVIGNVDYLQDSLTDNYNKRDTSTALLSRARATSTYEPKIAAGTTGQYWRGDKSWQTLNATAVGLGNVTNNAQVTSVTGSGVISSSGGTTPAISLSTAGASNGYSMRYISNAWRPWPDSTSAGGGSMVYPGAGIPVSTGSAWGTSITEYWAGGTGGIFYNNSANAKASIGTSTPLHPLHIVDGTDNYIDLLVKKIDSRRGAYAVLRGVSALEQSTAINDTLGVFGFSGQYYSGDPFPGAITAGIMGIAKDETFSASAQGSDLAILTTPSSDTTMVERVRVTDAGKVGIGTSTPAEKLEVAGSVKLSGNAKFDNAPDSDHTGSGHVITLTAGATNGIGDVVYIASTGKTALCKADAIANCPYALAICVDASVSADATGNYLTHGSVRDDTWNWTVGGLIYVSVTGTTGNTLTQTAPSSANNVIIPVGVALSADVLYFFGNMNTVEHQ